MSIKTWEDLRLTTSPRKSKGLVSIIGTSPPGMIPSYEQAQYIDVRTVYERTIPVRT